MSLLAVTQASPPRMTNSCRVITQPSTALDRGNGLVVLVDNDVLAAFRRAGVGDDALPPREHGLAFVSLRRQVGGDHVFRYGPEPDRLEVIVEDEGTALAHHGARRQVIEVGDHDVPRCQIALDRRHFLHDLGRVKRRRRHEVVGTLELVGPDGGARGPGKAEIDSGE